MLISDRQALKPVSGPIRRPLRQLAQWYREDDRKNNGDDYQLTSYLSSKWSGAEIPADISLSVPRDWSLQITLEEVVRFDPDLHSPETPDLAILIDCIRLYVLKCVIDAAPKWRLAGLSNSMAEILEIGQSLAAILYEEFLSEEERSQPDSMQTAMAGYASYFEQLRQFPTYCIRNVLKVSPVLSHPLTAQHYSSTLWTLAKAVILVDPPISKELKVAVFKLAEKCHACLMNDQDDSALYTIDLNPPDESKTPDFIQVSEDNIATINLIIALFLWSSNHKFPAKTRLIYLTRLRLVTHAWLKSQVQFLTTDVQIDQLNLKERLKYASTVACELGKKIDYDLPEVVDHEQNPQKEEGIKGTTLEDLLEEAENKEHTHLAPSSKKALDELTTA